MLTWLQVKNFAIADHVEMDINAGLSVITGETGAGKSIIINALAMVLGQRADSSIVKHGKARAEVQANFDISNNENVQALLRKHELDEDSECQLRRIIHTQTGSKAYINGRMVTASTLRSIGAQLVDIHGQNEHQSLLRKEIQRELLDNYAEITEEVNALASCYRSIAKNLSALNKIRDESAAAQQKLEFLKFQAEELERFSPQKNEWQHLDEQHKKAHHQAELSSAIAFAEQSLFGDAKNPSVSSQLSLALNELNKAQTIAPELQQICDILHEAQTLIQESEAGLRAANESVTIEESELELIEQRYATHMDLARKHRIEPDKLYETYEGLVSQLEFSKSPEQSEQGLIKEIEKDARQYIELAQHISKQRSDYARKMSHDITKLMQTLAMEGGVFTISLTPTTNQFDAQNLETLINIGGEHGKERIDFEVSTNAGIPKLPLAKIASGGELSRISLALQIILSDLATVNTLVFDEVDVGVGGKTAAIIGKMLAQLASSRQIICITHLPQVAAYGAQHFVVSKKQGTEVSLVISPLDTDNKVTEIARMVGGETLTEESLAHARTLVNTSH